MKVITCSSESSAGEVIVERGDTVTLDDNSMLSIGANDVKVMKVVDSEVSLDINNTSIGGL